MPQGRGGEGKLKGIWRGRADGGRTGVRLRERERERDRNREIEREREREIDR